MGSKRRKALGDIRRDPSRHSEKLVERHCQWIAVTCCYRTRPICSQSVNGQTVEGLVNPRGLSVDVLNDDTSGLLSSRARGHTYAVSLTIEAETDNNSRTEAHEGSPFFGLSNLGKSYY
jgi:hypothetical protein